MYPSPHPPSTLPAYTHNTIIIASSTRDKPIAYLMTRHSNHSTLTILSHSSYYSTSRRATASHTVTQAASRWEGVNMQVGWSWGSRHGTHITVLQVPLCMAFLPSRLFHSLLFRFLIHKSCTDSLIPLTFLTSLKRHHRGLLVRKHNVVSARLRLGYRPLWQVAGWQDEPHYTLSPVSLSQLQ